MGQELRNGPPNLSGDLQWMREGFKYLGVYLGSDRYEEIELEGNGGEGVC